MIATLKCAVEPLIADNPGQMVQSRLKIVMEKSGRIAKIAGVGLFKRALGMLITAGAVEASSAVLEGMDDDVANAIQKGLEDSGKDAVKGMQEIGGTPPATLMEQRVKDFEAGQQAMNDLKESLALLVESLEGTDFCAPIIIIIDELDRCRPTYAIKLLEEIKHLFDVPGLVFIFGMHSTALSHSVKATYGAEFDGAAYLRRFISRRYRLVSPSHDRYIEHLLDLSGIPTSAFEWNRTESPRSEVSQISFHELISEYMRVYAVSARDAHELIGMLETAAALRTSHTLLAAYLIPLAIGQMKGLPAGTLPKTSTKFAFNFIINNYGMNVVKFDPAELANKIQDTSKMSWWDLASIDSKRSFIQSMVFFTMTGNIGNEPLTATCNYPDLLSKCALIRQED